MKVWQNRFANEIQTKIPSPSTELRINSVEGSLLKGEVS